MNDSIKFWIVNKMDWK